MAREQLIIAARPKNFSELVGQSDITMAIRRQMTSGRVVKNWLFTGPKGCGKTSLARVLALAYQCDHQEKFGYPCLACRQKRSQLPIYEINAADITGINELRNALEGSEYGVLGAGKYRIYIIDEAHRASSAAQDLLLKYLEDTPKTTVFMLCSTMPHKIVDTLRSRCLAYQLHELDEDGIQKLATRLLKFVKSTLPADRLTEALIDKRVFSPRLVTQAVEKYAAGATPEASALVEAAAGIDTLALITSLKAGNWEGVRLWLLEAKELDVRAVRLATVAYLKTCLLDCSQLGDEATIWAEALQILCAVENAEDTLMGAALAVALYQSTWAFANKTIGSQVDPDKPRKKK